MSGGAEDRSPRVLIQPAAGKAAREHYRETIEEPVPITRIRSLLSEAERDELTQHYPEGELFIWGLTPGARGSGKTKWEKVSPGDVALFSWSNHFRACARVTCKTDNPELARELWGTNDDGDTWRYVYFLTEPRECEVPYEDFNEAVGFKRNFVPQGFNVLDEGKSEAVLREISEFASTDEGRGTGKVNSGIRAAFELFRNDRLESLRVRVRRYRAGEVRELLQSDSIEPDTFSTEVWRLSAGGQISGEEFADQFEDGMAPREQLLDRIEEALDTGELELHGNYHWRTGTAVFGAKFGEERRRQGINSALDILNSGSMTPLEKYRALKEVDGFGPSTASGIVMLMHPEDFAVYNTKSREAIRRLGRSAQSIEEFQRAASDLRDGLSATDFPELDRFLYLVAEDRIFVPDPGENWPSVWWVNQGTTYRQASEGGYVWAPTKNKTGTTLTYHENVARMCLGDRVLHYADGAIRAVGTVVGSPVIRERPANFPSDNWQNEGFYAKVEYNSLDDPIERDEIPSEWRHREDGGPFTKNAGVQQGYMFPLSKQFSQDVVGRFQELQARFPVPVPTTGRRPVDPKADLSAVVADFAEKLEEAHLSFGRDHVAVVRDFVVSLATKRLVILTGLSGSGKTQIAVQFGRWLGEDRYKVVPVRPDWTGAEALFGYPDALQESRDGRSAWHVPDPLRFMLQAARDPKNPYLMVLDEMNLAHVERYFADVISGMESEEGCLPNLQKEEDGTWRPVPGEDEPGKLPFPRNLFIAGTVNVDETTYMFSPKVLDRANTMEFTVETEDLRADIRNPGKCASGEPSLVRGFLKIARDTDWHRDHPAEDQEEFVDQLKRLHRHLDSGFSFGHRVLYEAVRFAALHSEADGGSAQSALDIQVLQKVLPRLHGSRRRLEPVLQTVGKFCWDLEPRGDSEDSPEGFDPVDPPDGEAALPRSFDKVRRMTERLRTNQFVSFTE